jgi:hypothetical protein
MRLVYWNFLKYVHQNIKAIATTNIRHLTTGLCSGVLRNIFGRWGGSTNSVEDRGQRERRSGGGNPLVRGPAQFANE